MKYILITLGVVVVLVVLCALFLRWCYPSFVTVPADSEPQKEPQYEQLIPKHIYQTMKSHKLPLTMKQAMDTWIDLNPEYTHHFYDDERCREFIKDYFSERVLKAYDSLIPGAFKADLWRYCLLYIKGGVYVDVDMIDILPLHRIISGNDEFITARDHDPQALFNAFICSVPGHPFMLAMINYTVGSVEKRFYGTSCLEPTGPLGFGKVLQKILDIKSDFNIGKISRNGYTLKLLDFRVGQEYIMYRGKPCIKNKYSEYNQNLLDVREQSSYYTLWLNRKIYKVL